MGSRESHQIHHSDLELFSLFHLHFKSHKPALSLLAILIIGETTFQLVNPQIIRYFIDSAQSGSDRRRLTIAAVLFISLAILQKLLNIAAAMLTS